ncbi:TPA: fimbria/pilus outer membrane usher protein [Escherichia coli]
MTAFRAAFKAYRMHQVLILPRFARLTFALGLATAVFPVDAEYYFNPRFLSNDLAESVDLSAFTKGREAPPGTYRVDIYLNDEFMASRDITFIADDNNADLIPCLSTDLLVSLGIKKSALLDNKEHSADKHVPDNSACTPLQDRLADASSEFDVGQQHLSLSVPQIYVGRMARGYVSPDLWEEGINAGLLNYSFNGNSINNRSNHNAGKSNYAYLNLQSGINIGSWRLRDNSTWSYNSGSSNSSDSNKWQHINTSAERDIIPLRSRLTVGDSYTDGDIFDSVNFRGLKINSTEAMLPDSQHGFAPVIHGIARGTAQVSVKQNGYDVYQTTVPPGPFTIDDINSAANGGDLQVTIKEADGSIQTLYVPYSSVPVLQRAGYTRYALAMGEYRSGNNLQSSPKFVQASLMHGLKGNWTPYGGMQIAEDYQAFNLGIGKDLGLFGAFSFDITQANTTSGGIIAHADGITFGQPLGDTMVLVKAPGADNVKIENQTGIHTDWRGYAILPFATEYRENRVALNANSLADNVELDETVVTVIPTHGAIARATFNAQIGGKVLMTLKYGNKSVPFGAIVTHGENKNGSIVAENGQVYLTGLPQSGKLQVSWGNDKNSNCIVDYKLPAVSPGTLLNQQTAICR